MHFTTTLGHFSRPDPRKMHWALGLLLVFSGPGGASEKDRPGHNLVGGPVGTL